VTEPHIPAYDELPAAPGAPPGAAWGVFGADDQVGSLNFAGADQVISAAGEVRLGRVFALNWALELPSPPVLGRAALKQRHIRHKAGWDDAYDDFYTQGSSQWDGLAHVRHPRWGYYNGRTDSDVAGGGGHDLGIEHWARRGIAGRFALLDVARHRDAAGNRLDPGQPVRVTVAELDTVAAGQGTALKDGDILLIRFGWISWYESLDGPARAALAEAGPPAYFPAAGLAAEEATARWLWDKHVAAVGADCPAVEAMPFDQADDNGFLHYRLIALLGMALGEMLALDELAAHCAASGRYTGMFTAAPLNKAGGAGSPANALAIV
jgi:kynurenine formamidase